MVLCCHFRFLLLGTFPLQQFLSTSQSVIMVPLHIIIILYCQNLPIVSCYNFINIHVCTWLDFLLGKLSFVNKLFHVNHWKEWCTCIYSFSHEKFLHKLDLLVLNVEIVHVGNILVAVKECMCTYVYMYTPMWCVCVCVCVCVAQDFSSLVPFYMLCMTLGLTHSCKKDQRTYMYMYMYVELWREKAWE